jgi:GTP-binding protein
MQRVFVKNPTFLKSLPAWRHTGLPDLPEICAAGRSNVGKSSLLNALVERTGLAKTSQTPGRTQSIVIFGGELCREQETVPFHLIDLPGYGYAKVSKTIREAWRPMMEGYFRNNKRLAACLALLDIRRKPSEEDVELLEMMAESGLPVLPVITKADKIPRTQRLRALRDIAEGLGVEDYRDLWVVSSVEKTGIPELMAELFELTKAKGAELAAKATETAESEPKT